MSRDNLLYADEVFRIQGAVFEVNRQMGRGFLEAVYQECLAMEFAAQKIPFREKPAISLSYKKEPLRQTYCPDFICYDAVILELKATRESAMEHQAQILNYLAATALPVGLLVNFGSAARATVQRFVR
jgi:GxxExxY protein